MKRFIVEQNGYVQLEANRTFIVEVPDDMSQEEAEELVKDRVTLPEDEGMAWTDDLDRKWIGYDVEIWETDVYESDGFADFSVIKLDELARNARR